MTTEEIKNQTTEELKTRFAEIKDGFAKRIYFFGTKEGDEIHEIEKELIARKEIFPVTYDYDR